MKKLSILGFLLLPLYLMFLPLYIQGGDTAELVAAGYLRLVAHPPGYPLYVWLLHIWTNLFAVSTIYWRASLFNAILGSVTIFILIKPIQKNLIATFIALVFVGLQSEFIEASVLPDVFSLHALFVATLGYLFLFSSDKRKNLFFVFFFILSFTNHHTTLFLLPACFYVMWDELKSGTIKPLIKTLLLSLIIFLGLYLSLFLLNPKSPFSWGNLQDLGDLFNHFIRADYGTFKLASSNESADFGPFLFLIKSLLPNLIVSAVALILVLTKTRTLFKNTSFIVWTFCMLVTFSFPLMMNVMPVNMGEEVLRRFNVMPLIMLFLWTTYLLQNLDLADRNNKLALSTFCLPLVFVNLYAARHFIGLRHDSIIEDYSYNIIQVSKRHSPSVVLLNSDSAFFGARYLLSMSETRKDRVAVISQHLFFHPWYLEKIKALVPDFQLPSYESIHKSNYLNTHRDLIIPNLGKTNIFSTETYKKGEGFKLTFFGLGRLLQDGEGTYFGDPEVRILTVADIHSGGPYHFTKKYLYYQYAHYYLAKANDKYTEDSPKESKLLWETSLRIVPYSFPSMQSLCALSSEEYKFCNEETLEMYKQLNRGFYTER